MTRDDLITLLNVYGEAQFRAGAARQLVEGGLAKLCASGAPGSTYASPVPASSVAPNHHAAHAQAADEAASPGQMP